MASNEALLRGRAMQVIRSEMASYDLLSKRSRIVYERASQRAINDDALVPMTRCAHSVFLHEPCSKCERSLEECDVYVRAALARLQSLLRILEKGASS
jgi:hypothetical protein